MILIKGTNFGSSEKIKSPHNKKNKLKIRAKEDLAKCFHEWQDHAKVSLSFCKNNLMEMICSELEDVAIMTSQKLFPYVFVTPRIFIISTQ